MYIARFVDKVTKFIVGRLDFSAKQVRFWVWTVMILLVISMWVTLFIVLPWHWQASLIVSTLGMMVIVGLPSAIEFSQKQKQQISSDTRQPKRFLRSKKISQNNRESVVARKKEPTLQELGVETWEERWESYKSVIDTPPPGMEAIALSKFSLRHLKSRKSFLNETILAEWKMTPTELFYRYYKPARIAGNEAKDEPIVHKMLLWGPVLLGLSSVLGTVMLHIYAVPALSKHTLPWYVFDIPLIFLPIAVTWGYINWSNWNNWRVVVTHKRLIGINKPLFGGGVQSIAFDQIGTDFQYSVAPTTLQANTLRSSAANLTNVGYIFGDTPAQLDAVLEGIGPVENAEEKSDFLNRIKDNANNIARLYGELNKAWLKDIQAARNAWYAAQDKPGTEPFGVELR